MENNTDLSNGLIDSPPAENESPFEVNKPQLKEENKFDESTISQEMTVSA